MIANDKTLPAHLLRKLLRYDPETGKLYWRERTADMFTDGHRDAVGNCNNWNAIYAESEALSARQRKGYLGGVVLYFRVKAHRVVWAINTGTWPQAHIDHIDGDPTNNRFENLRDVTNAENRRNSKLQSNNNSGCPGVRLTASGRWSARIKVARREIGLGTFDVKSDAILARKAAEEFYGFHQNHGRSVPRQPLGSAA